MLTPNDIREMKRQKKRYIEERKSSMAFPLATSCELQLKIYEEVLREIARGSIDPKTLAATALEPTD